MFIKVVLSKFNSFFLFFIIWLINSFAISHVHSISFNTSDVVVKTKVLKFNKKIANAYNASIIEHKDGYLVIFRHDTTKKWCKGCRYKKPQIKMVFVDKNFEQIKPIQTIVTDTASIAEDARVHALGDQLFLTYNDDPLVTKITLDYRKKEQKKEHSHPWRRAIFLGKLNAISGQLSDNKEVSSGSIQSGSIEKNWTPFEYPEKSGNLYYIYSTSPHKILEINNSNGLLSAKNISNSSNDIDQVWQKNTWGEIRGGTPARLVDGVYITFFHSWKLFPDFKSLFYVMGAYIFEAKPPFKILAITPNPIFFQDVYSSPRRLSYLNTLYPAGFVVEKQGKETLLHVSCGENDTSIRIVTINKDALLRSMVQLS